MTDADLAKLIERMHYSYQGTHSVLSREVILAVAAELRERRTQVLALQAEVRRLVDRLIDRESV